MSVQTPDQKISQEMTELINAQKALAINFQNAKSNQSQPTEGKTLLVTGGASGFGESFVTTFAKNPGCAAIIADFNKEKGEELETTLREAGLKVKFIQVDVTDWESVTSLMRQSLIWLKTLGQDRTIDHLICSAGVAGAELDLSPVSPEDFLQHDQTPAKAPESRSIQISIVGTLYTVAAAQKFGMGLHRPESEIGDKSITLLGSMAGYTGLPLHADYTASKWGVRGLFRSLLNDHVSDTCPVRVNLMAPYFVATPLSAHIAPKLQEMGVKLADIGDVRDTALRFIGDKSIHGRAVGVFQGGAADLGDDLGGDYSSQAVRRKVEEGLMIRSSAQVSKSRL
jgi:5'-hydroxyaverantin dehydrogenase